MAFCAVSDKSRENLNLLVKATILQDPSKLRNFKDFTQEILNILLAKGLDIEKAITLAKNIPQAVHGLALEKENRDLFKKNKVSIDAINDVEDQFDTYEGIAKFLGLKGEASSIVVVNEKQTAQEKKIDEHISKTNIEFAGEARIVNGKKYGIRVTGIAKVGFNDHEQDNKDAPVTDSPALKHGNTVDAIAKTIFDDENPLFEDYKDRIELEAFNSLVAKLKAVKTGLTNQGYVFRTAVTVYDIKTDVSGEIDLVAINPEGDAFILDFKTGLNRFSDKNLQNETLSYKADGIEVTILSKWKQYGTQGYLYSKMLEDQLGIKSLKKIGIIGLNINYDASTPLETNKIIKVNSAEIVNIPFSDIRSEFKDKSMEQIVAEYNKLLGQSLGPVKEITPRKPLPNTTKRKGLDRAARLDELAATDEQFKEDYEWFKNNPIGKDTLLRIVDVVDAGVIGRWTLDGIVLSKSASQGTLQHESWHRFSQVFMSQQEKIDLYKSIQKDGIDFTNRLGKKMNTRNAEFLDVEEFLAEEFSKYALNPSAYKYPTKNSAPETLFEKILAFLKRFFGIKPRPVQLFQKLYEGKLSEYTPSVNNAFWDKLNSLAMNSKGQEIVPNERFPLYVRSMDYLIGKYLRDEGKSLTAFKQSKKLQAQTVNYIFGENGELARHYANPTTSEQVKDEIYSIFENKDDFTKAYLNATSYETIKNFQIDQAIFDKTPEEIAALSDIIEPYSDVQTIDDDERESDNSKVELFTPDANDKSAMSLADDAIQDFFRTIPKITGYNRNGEPVYELNELGFPENHKYYDIYYRTKQLLSGAFEMSEMKARMEDPNNHRLFPELKLINEYIGRFMEPANQDANFVRNIQNVQFIQAFYLNMVMPEVPNMQLTLNFLPLLRKSDYFKTNVMVSYRTASRSLVLKIIQSWEKNFKDRRNKTFIDFESWDAQKEDVFDIPLYKTEDGKIFLNPFFDFRNKFTNSVESASDPTARKNGLKDFWDTMGVVINHKAFTDRASVNEMISIKNKLIDNIEIHKDSVHLKAFGDLREILQQQGMDISNVNTFKSLLQTLPSVIMDIVVKQYFISNPVNFFNEKKNVTVDVFKDGKIVSTDTHTDMMRFDFEDLAAIEGKYGDRISSGSFRIEDKTKYPYYIPNQILMTTEMLNKLASTTQFGDNMYLSNLDPLVNKWMKRSYFMKKMFDHNGLRAMAKDGENLKPIKILIEDIASVRTVTQDAQGRIVGIEKSPRSLLRDEKFFMDVLTLFRAGAIEIPRAETSSTMFSIRLSDYGKGKSLPISYGESLLKSSNNLPEIFVGIAKDYFASEIEKRQWYRQNDRAVKGADKTPLANQFNIFEGILSSELKQKVVDNMILGKTPEEIFATDNIEADFRKEIFTYFEGQVNELAPMFTKLTPHQQSMIKDVIGDKNANMKSVARAFVLNHFVLSEEFYQLYFGDLNYYKNSFKRGKYVTNTGAPFYIDNIRNEMLNKIQTSTMHTILTGTPVNNKDFRTFKTSIIKDVEMRSKYVSDRDEDNQLLQGILNVRLASGALAIDSPEYIKYKDNVKRALEKYNLINIADGQGIIGMDFYRTFSIITNIWDEEKEQEYERQKAIFRNHYDLYFKLDDSGNKVRLEGEELAAARSADRKLRNRKPVAFFNPLKISYTGPLAAKGPTRPVFDKFSVRPIIPEMAIGKRDEDLMMEMAEQDLDYVKFKSGSKVYQENEFDWYHPITTGEYDLTKYNVQEITPSELLSANLKHQLSTEGFKDENIFGSQFRKIVFGVKYAPNAILNPIDLRYFSMLEEEFMNITRDLLKSEEIDLFSLLGIEKKGNTFDIKDMKRFVNLIQSESMKRGVPINNVDYLAYDPQTKGTVYPIDYAFNRQQIQDLLSGMIDDRLRRLKVNGSSLIQVSSAGNESKIKAGETKFRKPTQEEIELYGTTGLHYYHIQYDPQGKPLRTSTMGVKVAMSKAYESLFELDAPLSLGISDENVKLENEVIEKDKDAKGNVIYTAGTIGTKIGPNGEVIKLPEEQSLKRLNQALKDPEWRANHQEKLRLIGYRIPTQSMSFIDNMEIMEFLPRAAGAILIPPIELIVKSGSDFDIDKMNVIRPQIENGKLVKPRRSKVGEDSDGNAIYREDTLEFINQKIKELVVDEYQLKKDKKMLNDIIKGGKADIDKLENAQRAIRYKMLDVAIQSRVNDSLIDAIVESIREKRRTVIPDVPIAPEIYFGSEEYEEDIMTSKQEYEKMVQELVILDNEITAIKDKLKIKSKEKGKIESVDLEWFNRKKQWKNARSNRMVSLLSELMSHPYYFEHLVMPSSAAMFEAYTNELMASQQNMTDNQFMNAMEETDNKLFDKSLTPREASTYLASLNAFDNLLSKRKDLGGYAIQRTFSDIFNFIKFSISREYTVDIAKGEQATKTVFTPLIAVADRDKVVKNGRIMMHGDSVSGVPISKSFDELISLTVDLAGSPAYPKMGINNYNKKYVQYLLHQKVDAKSVLWFINQPILKELFELLEKQRRLVSGYTLKHAITELSIKKNILKNPPLYDNNLFKTFEVYHIDKVPAKYDLDNETILEEAYLRPDPTKANSYLSRPYWYLSSENITEADYFSIEDMDAAIRSGNSNTDMQKKILAYFGSITEEADWLMKLQFAENVDTTTYATLTSLIRNENNRREIRTSGIFDNNQIDMIEQNSMIAPFDYTDKAKAIYKLLFKKLYTSRTINSFSTLISDIYAAKSTQVERIAKIIENDFIEFIYKNFGTFRGENLTKVFQNELINLEEVKDHKYFSDRLADIVGKYGELAELPFVAGLMEDVYFAPDIYKEDSFRGLDNKEIHNIFFLRNPDNPVFERNVYTNNWRNLINFDPQKLGLQDSYSRDDIQKISQFFHELVYFSLYQSGLTNTGNGFSDLIPYEEWAPFIMQAFDAYEEAKRNNSNLEVEYLREFEVRFKQMNPKVDWRTKTRRLTTETNGRPDKENILFFKNYYRGKDYFVTQDDILMSTHLYLLPDEKAEGNLPASNPANQSPFEPGVYVEYQGFVGVLLSKTRDGVWRIYNLDNDTVSVDRESRITTLRDKGVIVKFGLKTFLVTKEKEIIDVNKQQKLHLATYDASRLQILKAAEQQQKPDSDSGAGGIGPSNAPRIPDCP